MKKAYLHLAACLMAAGGMVSSCDDYLYMEDVSGFTLSTAPYFLHTDASYLMLSDVVETPYTFNVKNRSVPWQLNIADDWLKISPASGDGTDTLTTVSVGADNNENTYYRISVMNLESQLDTALFKYSHPIVAEQIGTSESGVWLSCDVPLYVAAAASTMHINVTHNTQKLEIYSDDDWINVTQDEDGCSVQFDENTYGYTREGRIYFTVYNQTYSGAPAESELYYLQVTQYVAQCSVSDEILYFPNTAGSKTITVSSDLTWAASSPSSWISVSPTHGAAGVTDLTVTVVENNGISEREGSVTVGMADGTSIIIPVIQSGLYVNTDLKSVTLSDNGGSVMVFGHYTNITLSTNLSFWTVLSCPDWLTVTPDNGEAGEYILTLKAENNPQAYERKGTMTIGNSGLGLTTTVDVAQYGKYFNLPSTIMNFERTASSAPLTVNTNGEWTATTTDDWITVTPSSGQGTAQLTVSVTANDADTDRSGTIRISVGTTTELVTVTQKGRYLTIDRNTESVLPSTGGTIELGIASNQTWSAAIKNQSSWLTLSATQGEGNATLVITATDNPSLESREDTIVFTPAGGQQGIKLPVKQSGRYLSADVSSVSFFYTGGTAPITIKTDGTFRIEVPEDATWLHATQTEPGHLLTLKTEAYDGEEPRKTTVSIYLTGLSGENTEVKMLDITVTQYTKTTQFIRLDYDEDKDFNLTYKDGVFISRKEFKEDKPFVPNPTDNMNIGKNEYGEDKSYEY